MPILAGYKLKVAARLNSRALRADAVESICLRISVDRFDSGSRDHANPGLVVAG